MSNEQKTVQEVNLPTLWSRIKSYVNSRIPNGSLAGKDIAPLDMGGTNATNAKDARVNLGITYGTEIPIDAPETGSGTVYFFEDGYTPMSIVEGGTGANTAEGARNNLGLTDSGWIKTTNGVQEVKYRRKNGWVYVHVRHSPSPITGTTWAVVYTLPEGFRPSEDIHIHCDNSGSTIGMQAKVYPDGRIEIYGSATTQHFNVVGTFPVD